MNKGFLHQVLEPTVHGRARTVEFDEIYFGVHEQLLYAKKIKPVEGTVACPVFLVDITKQCFLLIISIITYILLSC